MIPPDEDSRWFAEDDRFTANLKMIFLLIICEIVAFILVFLVPVYLHKMSPNTMAVPLIAVTFIIAILFGLKFQVDNSCDGTGRGRSWVLILGTWILIVIGYYGLLIFFKLLDKGILEFSGQMRIIVMVVLFLAFTGLLLYHIVLTEGWD